MALGAAIPWRRRNDMDWYLGVLKQYAVFDGRARRKEYWMFVLFNFVIAAALGLLGRVIGLAARGERAMRGST